MKRLFNRLGAYWLILRYGRAGAQRHIVMKAARLALRLAPQVMLIEDEKNEDRERWIAGQIERVRKLENFGRG